MRKGLGVSRCWGWAGTVQAKGAGTRVSPSSCVPCSAPAQIYRVWTEAASKSWERGSHQPFLDTGESVSAAGLTHLCRVS